MAKSETPKTLDLREVFLGLQKEMIASLSATRQLVPHPGTKGDATELQWLTMLNNYLPERYFVDKAFVLDCDGQLSEQIDVVIYDRQYSPFLFNQNFVKYIPAESVYAVLEVKQDVDSSVVKYAGQKVASVRRLRRTTAPIPYAGGVHEAKEPARILGGLLTLGSEWNPSLGEPFVESILALAEQERLDVGCALACGGFSVNYDDNSKPKIEVSSAETSLIFFFLRLVARLREIGTVPALDLSAYGRVL
jgi:hypothetical protein